MKIKDQHKKTLNKLANRYIARDDANNWDRDYLVNDILDEYENHNLWERLDMPYPRHELKDYLKEVGGIQEDKGDALFTSGVAATVSGFLGALAGMGISDDVGGFYGTIPVASTLLSGGAAAKATYHYAITRRLNNIKETTAEILNYQTSDNLDDMIDEDLSSTTINEGTIDEKVTDNERNNRRRTRV